MTEVDAYLHYRLVDVSTLKELARRWFPETYAAVPKKSERHRAMEDIRGSVDELRFYQQVLFADRGDREARIKALLNPPASEPS
jgi:oligoribonuclease